MNNDNNMNDNIEEFVSKKMKLSLDIIKLKHKIKDFKLKNKNIYKIKKEYQDLIKKIILLLEEQEKIDYKSFIDNIIKDEELLEYFKKETIEKRSNFELFEKLSITEKEFLRNEEYDIEQDPYKIFSIEKSPRNEFVDKWEKIQKNKHNSKLHDYYKDRDWNNL